MDIKPLKFILYSTEKDYSINTLECKNDILCKLKYLFGDKEKYNIFCTKHNIVVEHTEIPYYSHTEMILRFVFNVEGRLIYALITDLGQLELDKIEFNGHTIRLDNLVEDIRLHKDSYMDALCGYYDDVLPEEALEDGSTIKLCHEYDVKHCSDCPLRDARRLYICSADESNHLEYKMDKAIDLTMYEYPEAEGIMNDKYSYIINREDNTMVDTISLLSEEEQKYYYECTFESIINSEGDYYDQEYECYDLEDECYDLEDKCYDLVDELIDEFNCNQQ